jgi:hypothetical protein
MLRKEYILTSLFIALTILGNLGCATTKAVREIVAKSNAAIVDVPSLTIAPDPNKSDWRQAVAHLDRVILQNPDQKILVATLRLRQAVLLTTRQQIAEANETWKRVVAADLMTERDRALYSLHTDLVWWYEHVGNRVFGHDNIGRAVDVKENFIDILDGLTEHSDIRFYLEAMRANIALKAANSTNTFEKPDDIQQKVARDMVKDLKRLVDQYDNDDYNWVCQNAATAQTEADSWIARLRARVWLRDAISEYQKIAMEKQLNPGWEPDWIDDFPNCNIIIENDS